MADRWINEAERLMTSALGRTWRPNVEALATALSDVFEAGRREEREACANVAEEFGPNRPLSIKDPPSRILGRWEGEQAASSSIAAAIRRREVKP